MRLSRDDEICGVRLIEVRDFFRRYWHPSCLGFDLEAMCDYLCIGEDKAKEIITASIEKGWIEKRQKKLWALTNNAGGLINAKAIPPTPRAKAEKIFADFMERVHEVNRNPYYLYYVEKVILFGSFMTDSPDVGDIDLVVETCRKRLIGMDCIDTALKRAKDSGKSFSEWGYKIDYPCHEVKLYLKNKIRVLSITSRLPFDPVVPPHKIIYESQGEPEVTVYKKHPEYTPKSTT